MQVACIHGVPVFMSDRDGHWFPVLRVLHQYPDMMPKLRTDQVRGLLTTTDWRWNPRHTK
jgi:hypothetical protein